MLIATARDWSNVVRARRRELGLSQDALADRIGMSRQWVVRFENGAAGVATIDHLLALTEALELDVNTSAT